MSQEKIGPLDKDTALVLAITGFSTAVILTLSGIIMLANSWTTMAQPDRVVEEYVPSHGGHGGHGEEHGDDHGDDHGGEHAEDHGDEH